MKNNNIFQSPTKGRLELTKVVKEISDFVSQDSRDRYQLIVGTDSNSDKRADFVTAIIVYRVGHGGRYFWKKTNGNKVYHTIRDRVYKEVTLSLDVAQDLLAKLESLMETTQELNYDFQIHIDVGQNGPTREMIKEVVGMVRGNGFKVKIKPSSYAASHVADRYI